MSNWRPGWGKRQAPESGGTVTMIDIRPSLGITGWMTEMELTWLARKAISHRRIIELGSWQGRTTTTLCNHTQGVVFAVDQWQPWTDRIGSVVSRQPESLIRAALSAFQQNMALHISQGRCVPLRLPHRNSARVLEMVEPDMVFVDGDHSEAGVQECLEPWVAYRKDHPHVLLCGHDYEEAWPGLMRVVDDLVPDRQLVPGTIIWTTEL